MTESELSKIEAECERWRADTEEYIAPPPFVADLIAEVRRLQTKQTPVVSGPITVPLYQNGRLVGMQQVDPFTVAEREALIAEISRLREGLGALKAWWDDHYAGAGKYIGQPGFTYSNDDA